MSVMKIGIGGAGFAETSRRVNERVGEINSQKQSYRIVPPLASKAALPVRNHPKSSLSITPLKSKSPLSQVGAPPPFMPKRNCPKSSLSTRPSRLLSPV